MIRPLACAAMFLGLGVACRPTPDANAPTMTAATRAAEAAVSTTPRLPGSTAHGYARADTAATRQLADSLAAYEKRRAARR